MAKKKFFRKIPKTIEAKLSEINSQCLLIGCVVKVSNEDIKSGKYNHLGIAYNNSELSLLSEVLPPKEIGHISKRNITGQTITHKNDPKVTISYSITVPNFGDWNRGSHIISFTPEVYRKTFIAPKLFQIKTDLLEETSTHKLFKFSIDTLLNRSQNDFNENLLHALSLLQENVGAIDIFSSDLSAQDFLRSIQVTWEILPPGNREDNLTRILSSIHNRSDIDPRIVRERYLFLESLNPRNFVQGMGGFQRYFGAQFSDDLVVFENLASGNAIYIMQDNWRELSQKSRLELLSGNNDEFTRITHKGNWKQNLKNALSNN